MAFDGRRLAALRRRRKMTQAQLAERAGCNRVSLARWESGARQPLAEMIVRLAAALGVRSDTLMPR